MTGYSAAMADQMMAALATIAWTEAGRDVNLAAAAMTRRSTGGVMRVARFRLPRRSGLCCRHADLLAPDPWDYDPSPPAPPSPLRLLWTTPSAALPVLTDVQQDAGIASTLCPGLLVAVGPTSLVGSREYGCPPT
jgi:hypothetical protein